MIKFGAVVVAGTLALSACGSRDEEPETTTTEGSTAASGGEERTLKIGVIAPLSGDLSALGLGIQNSVDLAIQQANESGDLGGVTLELAAEDDTATPDVGQQAASALADDEEIVGVVGTLNSSVALSAAPVLNSAGIAMVSPANTNPTLTLGDDSIENPARVWDTYFRTATTDNQQGPFAAEYVFNELGFTEVAIIHDQKAYGEGLSRVFGETFTELGGTVTTTEVINPDEDDFSAVAGAVAATNPQLVYYGGEYPQAGPLSAQLDDAGLTVPLMGGDGIYDGQFIELGGADGDAATSVGAPTTELESAADFVAAYEEAGFSEPYAAYGAYAYDSANAIIEALKAALAEDDAMEGADLQAAVVEQMSSVEYDGATGTVSFDEYGDTTNKTLTVYAVEGGEFVPVSTGEYQG